MGCGGSKLIQPPPGGWGQSAALRKLLIGGGDGESSPQPSLELKTVAGSDKMTGQIWCELFRAGFVHLYRNKDQCNKINVFPVPDGDTGTNMVITTRPAVMTIGGSPPKSLKDAAIMISGQTTLNAQGNSGTIFSFTFSKLADAIGDKEEASVAEFATYLNSVSEKMMSAMDNPVPGTMLSVIGEAFSKDSTKGVKSVGELINACANAGNAALQLTPDQLIVDGKKVLKNFRGKTVVDSGSQGFCYLLDGMVKALAGEMEFGEYMESGTAGDVALDEGVVGSNEVVVHDDDCALVYKYCTEAVGEAAAEYTGNEALEKNIREALQGKGDSLGLLVTKLSDSVNLFKVHIHSNDPEDVFSTLGRFTKDGHLYKQKAEDMSLQVSLSKAPRQMPNPDDADVGIVWTSVADLPEDMVEHWREGMVPLIVTVDSSSYKDKVSISSLAFFNMLRRRDFYKVGTSGWNMDDVGAALKLKLAKHKEVLVCCLPFGLSKGTGNALENAMKLLPKEDQDRITVMNHSWIAPPEGGMVMRAHYYASQGKTAKQIKKLCNDWLKQPNTFATVYLSTLTYLRLGGRLADKDKGIMKKVYDFIESKQWSVGMKTQFIEMDKDKPDCAKLGVAFKGPPQKVLDKQVDWLVGMAEQFPEVSQFDMSVGHSAAPHDVAGIVAALRSRIKIRTVYFSNYTALFGVHGGPGLKGIMLWPADEVHFPQVERTKSE